MIAPLVSTLVLFDRRLPFLLTWNAGAYPLVLQRFSEPVSVVAAIPEHPFDVVRTFMDGPVRRKNLTSWPPGIARLSFLAPTGQVARQLFGLSFGTVDVSIDRLMTDA